MHITSNLSKGSKADNIPVAIFCYGDKRKFLVKDKKYEETIKSIQKAFSIPADHAITLKTSSLDVCRDRLVEIDSTAYPHLYTVLDEIVVLNANAHVAQEPVGPAAAEQAQSKGKGRAQSTQPGPSNAVSAGHCPEPAHPTRTSVSSTTLGGTESPVFVENPNSASTTSGDAAGTKSTTKQDLDVFGAGGQKNEKGGVKAGSSAGVAAPPASSTAPTTTKGDALPSPQSPNPAEEFADHFEFSDAAQDLMEEDYHEDEDYFTKPALPETKSSKAPASPQSGSEYMDQDVDEDAMAVVHSPDPELSLSEGVLMKKGANVRTNTTDTQTKSSKRTRGPSLAAELFPDSPPTSKLAKVESNVKREYSPVVSTGHGNTKKEHSDADVQSMPPPKPKPKFKPAVSGNGSGSRESVSSFGSTAAATSSKPSSQSKAASSTSSNAKPPSFKSTPAVKPEPVSASEADDPNRRILIVMHGPSEEHSAQFKMRSKHTIAKILKTACASFGLDVDRSKLFLARDTHDLDGEVVETEWIPCPLTQTVGECGVRDGGRMMIAVEGWGEDDDSEGGSEEYFDDD